MKLSCNEGNEFLRHFQDFSSIRFINSEVTNPAEKMALFSTKRMAIIAVSPAKRARVSVNFS